jgi:hypothetical protein
MGLYLCGLIRNGIMSRNEAAEICVRSEDDRLLKKSVKDVFKFLKISSKIVDAFLTR